MKPSTYTIYNDHILSRCQSEIETRAANSDDLRVRIDNKIHPKSERQLGYVWACVYPFLQNAFQQTLDERFDIQDIHLYHVEIFNEHKAGEISKAMDLGMGPRIIKTSMSDWVAGQMSSYIEWMILFYADKGVYIPEADQFWKERGIRNSRGVEL